MNVHIYCNIVFLVFIYNVCKDESSEACACSHLVTPVNVPLYLSL